MKKTTIPVVAIIIAIILALTIGIPFIYFIGWLFGNIAVFFFSSQITSIFAALHLSSITADNFPQLMGVLSIISAIALPTNFRINKGE